MATTKQDVQGKVGNTICYKVGMETRVRGISAGYSDANTPTQQANRSRLRVATRFYQHLAETHLKEVWRVAAGAGGNAFNYFMKVNMMVFKPNGKIGDFSRLQMTVGLLQKVNCLTASVDEDDRVTLTWEAFSGLPSARGDDRLMVVVLYANRSFSPLLVEGIEATRRDGMATFQLQRKRGTAAHLYCFFGRKEGKAYSMSQHVRI